MTYNPFDAVVIGSGATGGMAALSLAQQGVRVLVIEAGPQQTSSEAMGSEPLNSLKRIRGLLSGQNKIQAQHPGYWKSNPSLYVNENENKYFYPPKSPFIWTQGRQVGGRSLTWGGITLRLSETDFKASSIDGYGPEWPINYLDLENYYTYVEKFLKVHGNNDDLDQLPNGHYLESLPFTSSEEIFAKEVRNKLNYPVIHSRGFGPHNRDLDGPWPRSSSVGSTLKEALKTGKVEILADHIVEHIVINKSRDKATGVIAIDRTKKERKKIDSNLIFLASSTIQSLKILLNSSERYREGGLIDPSGKLGSYLMDHISTCRFFSIPNNNQRLNINTQTLTGAGSFFIPFGRKLDSDIPIDFIRGYGIWGAIDRFEPPVFLKSKPNTKTGFLIGHGEVLPYADNKVTLTQELDDWGIAIPHINFKWNKNELKMVAHMNKTIEKSILSSGGEIRPLEELINAPFFKQIANSSVALQQGPPPPGYYIHEVGGAPMGTNEEESVLDKWNRLWRCKNLIVVDGACWPTSSWQSPTLTMMAITRRACISVIKNQLS